MANHAYLVSDGKTVSVTFERPERVRVGKKHWKQRFRLRIGEGVTIYTDDPWKGVIGVYDTSNEEHLLKLLTDMREHSLSLAERRMEYEIHRLLGSEASSEVYGYMWAFDSNKQRNHKWSPLGRLLWDITQAMKGICFRGE
jgi:hypothetical protein